MEVHDITQDGLAYTCHSFTVNGLPEPGTPERQPWEAKITLLERFNGRTCNPVPGGTVAATLTFWSGNFDLLNQSYKALAGKGENAANDETWRIAA